MRTRTRFLLLHGLIFLLGLNSCSINKKEKEIPQNQITANDLTGENRCEQLFKRIQVELFNANPISSGADSLIAYLEKDPSFIRNKKYDHGNGSVRFNAKDAEVYGYKLIDEKSLFLINYTLAGPQKNKVFLFQAIYYFENKEDQLELTQRMKKFLSEAKGVKKTTSHDIAGNPYDRYSLPCGSGMNFKYSKEDDEQNIINIFWIDR